MRDFVITIGRQYGAGGRTIGKALATKLGIPYYDSELIVLAAKKNDVNKEFYTDYDEKPGKQLTGLFYYPSAIGFFSPVLNDVVINDQVFRTQAEIIKEVSEKPCIIVGRCSEYVLRDKPNVINLFLYADIESRKRRLIEIYKVDGHNIAKQIKKADKQRAMYYNTYTDMEWGDVNNYDLCINTARLTIDDVVDTILKYIEARSRELDIENNE